jgi:organic hydroperoxide reductase OsmC/OhrA
LQLLPLGRSLRAQQAAMPVVGFVRDGSADTSARLAFRKGLNEAGYVEGQNVTVEYHWLEGQYNRLPQLMADLVRRQVAVIATPGNVTTAAAKAATATIPIVFGVGDNPIRPGLVASLAHPGGNATGINFFTQEVVAKRLRCAYSRAHEISAQGKTTIAGSSDPMFRGDAARWNPAELLIAALSACHQLWYLHLCADAGIVVVAYSDNASGVEIERPDDAGQFESVTLRPHAKLGPGSDENIARHLHDTAAEKCFIARSMSFKVKHEPTFEIASAYGSHCSSRRRGNRNGPRFVAAHYVCFWHKRTERPAEPMSAFGGKADIASKLLTRDEARRIYRLSLHRRVAV